MVIHRVGELVGGRGFFQVGHGEDDGAEKFLGFGTLSLGHAHSAHKSEIHDGEGGGHSG